MIVFFEQLPFVYQVETLVHVHWLAEEGIEGSYTQQTLENDLRQEALRLWQEEKYELNNILRNLTTSNSRRDSVVSVIERLLRYKRTRQFQDGTDARYRDKDMMNYIYEKQLKQLEQKTHNLNELSTLVFPNQSYNFNQLKQEITRLKYQELTPQIRCERAEFEQLIVNSKTKVGRSFERVVDLLLEAQKQICEIEPESNEHYQVKGQLIAYQIILENNLTKDELQSLLTRQNELHQLEKHLLSLQMMNN